MTKMLLVDAAVLRGILAKAAAGDVKIANQAGYAFYGGRWHKVGADKPAPKGAPLAAHPYAAGMHPAVKHLSDSQWEQLKLPASNVNASSFNAALDKLKGWAEAGNVTAIVGAGYGTNTYGKKLAQIANHLLLLHGSDHKVEAGQKVGEHAGVQAAPDDGSSMPVGQVEGPLKGTMLGGKIESKTPEQLQVIVDHPGGFPKVKEHAQAVLAAKTKAPAGAGSFEIKGHNVSIEPLKSGFKLKIDGEFHGSFASTKDAKDLALAYINDLPSPAGTSPLQMPDFAEGKTVTGVKALYEGVAKKIIDHANAGNLSVVEDIPDLGKKMWQGKTPNSKKLLALHAAALEHAKGGSKPATPAPAAAEPFRVKSVVQGGLMSEGGVFALQADDYSGVEEALGLAPGKLQDDFSPTYTVTDHKGRTFSVYKHGGALSVRTSGQNKDGASAKELLAHLKAANEPKHGAGWDKTADGSDVYADHPKEGDGVKLFSAADADTILSPAWKKAALAGVPLDKLKVREAAITDLQMIAKQAKGDKGVQSHDGPILVAHEGGQPVAALSYKVHKTPLSDEALEVRVVGSVSPGAGKGLMEKVIAEAKSKGIPVHLQASSGAMKFYEGMGFVASKSPYKDGPGLTWMTLGGPNEGDTKTGANGQQLVFKNGRWHKYVDADESGELPPALVPASDADQASGGSAPSSIKPYAELVEHMKQHGLPGVGSPYKATFDALPTDKKVAAIQAASTFTPLPDTGPLTAEQLGNVQSIPWFKQMLPAENSNAKSHNAAVTKIQNMALAGDKAGLQAFIDAKAGAKQTYAKKQHLLAQTALAALGDEKPAEVKPEHFEVQAGDVFKLDSQYEKMNAGEWTVYNVSADGALVYMHKVGAKVPNQTNSATIPAATLAAAVAKGTAKKQAATTGAVTELTAKQVEGLKGWIAAGQPTSKHPDSWSNLWKKLSPGMKKAVKEETGQAPTKIAGKPAYDHLVQAKKAAGGDANAVATAAEQWAEANIDDGIDSPDGAAKKAELKEALLSLGEVDTAIKLGLVPNPAKSLHPAAKNAVDTLAELHGPDALSTIIGSDVPQEIADYAKQKLAGLKAAAPAAPAEPAAPRIKKVSAVHLTNTLPGHNKFWAASLSPDGLSMLTTYGKIGSPGQKTLKTFPTQEKAAAAIDKLINEKKDKGYKYVGEVDHFHAVAPKAGAAPAADPMGGWSYTESDPGMSGSATLSTDAGLIAYDAEYGVAEYHDEVSLTNADGEGVLQASSLEQLLQQMAEKGAPIPPLAALQKLKPSIKASSVPAGPKDGDTKMGADGMLVFKNGRWHKVEQTKTVKALTQAQITAVGEHPKNTWTASAKIAAKKGDEQALASAYAGAPPTHVKTKAFIEKLATQMGASLAPPGADSAAAAVADVAAAPAAPAAVAIPSMDDWVQTGGQGGSNPGGKFKDQLTGVEYYCKFPADESIARSEVLAAKLYGLAGLAAQDAMLVRHKGKLGIASKWVTVKKADSPAALAATKEAQAGFAVDAWLANWDVVGLGYDNLQVGTDGKAVRIDAGGSLEYRAQGAKKPFGPKVDEIDTLRDAKKNPQAASVFGKMTDADITASVAKVAAIDDAAIRALVFDHGPGTEAEKKALADTLIARKQDLLARYPKAAKPGKKPLDPSKLPVDPKAVPKPHDFENWNGPGKGLSSKDVINKSNAAVEYQMMALAQAGNLTALRSFEFDEVNKDTGQPTGVKSPVTKHPSKHVQQYHQDLLQILEEVANPPEPLKVFADTDVSSLGALSAAFPPKKFGTTVGKVASNEKLGFWVALGAVGGVEKFRPKSFSNYTAAAISAAKTKYQSASKLAKHFISSVQASGSYNDLFRDGKTHDHQGNSLKDVAKAALAHATEMPEGTSLYRWQKMSPQMVAHVMSAKEGTVFQATGPMCTSYDPTATKGFGTHRVVVRYAKGAKAVESFASGAFSGEKEVTTLPNSRFVILSRKMVPDVEHGNPSGQRLELEILMLPPDLGI